MMYLHVPRLISLSCRQVNILTHYTADTIRRINVGLTLVRRRRRWADVKPTMIHRHVCEETTNNKLRIETTERRVAVIGCPNMAKTWRPFEILLGYFYFYYERLIGILDFWILTLLV